MIVVVGRHVEQSQGGCLHIGRCRSTSRVICYDTDDDRPYSLLGARVWVGCVGIGRCSWKGPNTGRHERLLFVVHAAGWQHSMLLHGRCCC